jgi:site-specific recombinase XerD
MTALAPTLESWFTDRLMGQRHASPNTVSSSRDTWRLLLGFVQSRSGKQPSRLDIAHLDAELIGDFLNHLEQERHNGIRTRNARLAAIRSFYRYAALRHPKHAALIARVLDIPIKRCERKEVNYLDHNEVDALLDAPDRDTWTGRRDRVLLDLAVETGLRVSELTGLRIGDIHLGTGAHLRCRGKGRKQRCTPISKQTVALLRPWIHERDGTPDDSLFPTRRGTPLSRSAVGCLVAKYTATAAQHCPSLQAKRPTPHALRHTCAMSLLAAGCDTSVIALWLGHEQSSTTDRIYLHGDMTIKQKALDRTRPRNVKPGRYRPADPLLAFLSNL